MTIDERYAQALQHLAEHYPDADTELDYHDPFSLLVAVVLSAQCTDKRVNLVTPQLFAHYPTPRQMAKATPEDLLAYMGSVSYPNSKAKHLIALSEQIVSRFDGEVPTTREGLESLTGVGRKSASVMLAVCFDTPAMPVDTHVFRVSKRIGLAPQTSKTPLDVEQALVKRIPQEQLIRAHHQLILLGRYICKARKPLCEECRLQGCCRYFSRRAQESL